MWEVSVASAAFFWKSKTALKIKQSNKPKTQGFPTNSTVESSMAKCVCLHINNSRHCRRWKMEKEKRLPELFCKLQVNKTFGYNTLKNAFVLNQWLPMRKGKGAGALQGQGNKRYKLLGIK